MNPPRRQYLSTADAAALLGVGATSVKRWADLGLLRCVRTAGNHRRFTPDEVHRFANSLQGGQSTAPTLQAEHLPPSEHVMRWTDRLLALGPIALHDALCAERSALGGWWHVADIIGAALGELGERWLCGEIGVIDEHLASERLTRALARCSEAMSDAAGRPAAVLATAEGEEHTLGLALAELVLREAGYTVDWVGRNAPAEQLAAHVQRRPPALVALSASPCRQDAAALRVAALPIAHACQATSTRLILGGAGHWPADLPQAQRVHNFADLHETLGRCAQRVH
jgi:excisionase family DNA binding protein